MELTDIRLRGIMQYDPFNGTLEQCHKLKYFRLPNDSEYPLDLKRGFDTYVHRNGVFPGAFDLVQKYLMKVDQTKQLLQETDFILNRRTLLMFMEPTNQYSKVFCFEAFRFKECIFVKLYDNSEQNQDLRSTYAFKVRQYLLTERFGEAPNTWTSIDERMQQYGMFSARIGQFRLLYSGELTGLSNTDPLGDLTDQKELDKPI
ncbi:uncharacterized protein LOC110184151 [Drosophila serrata]|uniref:uncharacterized protein LOC110184151 n=1 Tax=Drosophila serrata TaxID=7274 RepID=UPI000A1D2B2C|nr:uncharacterized protein LOC110184151 [Drosophila serrata]